MASDNSNSLSDNSVILEALSYRSLQLIAQENALPGTLKKPVMVAMLHAKRAGDEAMVNKIVEENRRYRGPKPDASAKGDKKTTLRTTAKRKGPGRPRREKTPEDAVPEKRNKGVHPFAACGQMFTQGAPFERMPSTQLHSTQPLLRALLDTTPSLEYTTRSVIHTNIPQPNLFFNRPPNVPPNLQSIPIYHNTYNSEHNIFNQYNLPSKMQNGNRYQVTVPSRDHFQQQPYPTGFNEAGFNDFHAPNFNGHPMLRKVASAETILPDLTADDDDSRTEHSLFNHEIPLKYTHSLFNGGSDMRTNMFNANFAGQEGWNGSNRFQFGNGQDNAGLRHMISMRQRRVLSASSSTTGFKDTGGIVVSNVYERDLINGSSEIVYDHRLGCNQVFDLSVPKPNSSQSPVNRAPGGSNIHPQDFTNYSNNYQPSFVGSSQDVAYTQTNNMPGQQAFEPGVQHYAGMVDARPPPPAYQSPRSLRRSQDVFEMQDVQCSPVDLQFAPTENAPRCLEYLYNLRRERLLSGGNNGRAQKQNTATTTTNFYTFPLISSRAYAPYSGSEATESSPEDTEGYEGEPEVANASKPLAGDQSNTGTDTISWSGTMVGAQQTFDRNPFLLPPIYDFLDPPELPVGEQLHNVDATGGASLTLTQSASTTSNMPLANSHLLELTPMLPNHPRVECPVQTSSTNSVGRHFTTDAGLVRCRNSMNGCQLVLQSQQVHLHEQGCVHRVIHCPMDGCSWSGKLGCLADHIVDVGGHKLAIFCGEKQTFTFNLAGLRDSNCVHFVQQAFTRLFVVTVALSGYHIHVFLQEINRFTGEDTKGAAAKGYLEIGGKDGYPFSWNGLVVPIQNTLMNIVRARRCLSIHVGDIKFDANNCVTLTEMVTL